MVTIIAGQIEANVQQQGDTTVVGILNGLRVGELTAEHLAVPMQKVSKDMSSEFSIEKSFRFIPQISKYTTNQNHHAGSATARLTVFKF